MTAALMIDMQDRLLEVMNDKNELILQSKILLKGLKILEIPLFVSEQYPKGLGNTSGEFSEYLTDSKVFEKREFSCLKNRQIAENLRDFDEFIIFGIETHICVFQSVKDLLALGKEVKIIASCTSSRELKNRNLALDLMSDLGARIYPLEGVLFEIMQSSTHPKFKDISGLIK